MCRTGNIQFTNNGNMHQLCVFYLPPPFQLGALPTPSSPLSESLSVQTQCNRAPSQTEGKVQVTFPEKGENEKECKGESAKQSKKAVSADLLIVRHPFCRPSNPIPRYFKIKILMLHLAVEVKNQSKSENPPLSPSAQKLRIGRR